MHVPKEHLISDSYIKFMDTLLLFAMHSMVYIHTWKPAGAPRELVSLLAPTSGSCMLSPYAELRPDTLCSPVMLSTPLPPLSEPALPPCTESNEIYIKYEAVYFDFYRLQPTTTDDKIFRFIHAITHTLIFYCNYSHTYITFHDKITEHGKEPCGT
jgi:hypothetical protein